MSDTDRAVPDVHDPDVWIRDLVSAGWVEKSYTIWIAPDGSIWRGPYGAWREMKKRERKGAR